MDNKIKEGTILVCKWGYTMILATFVRVKKVSDKTILCEEIKSRSLSEDELKEAKLKPAYLQVYSLPTEELTIHNGKQAKPWRLYCSYPALGIYSDGWFSKRNGYRMYFQPWDGKPVFEDHCD